MASCASHATKGAGIPATSPDQDHLLSEWYEPGYQYRIWGTRGMVQYFVMAAWKTEQDRDVGSRDWATAGTESLKEFDPAMLYTTAFLQSDNIHFDVDGIFEVYCTREKPEGKTGCRSTTAPSAC